MGKKGAEGAEEALRGPGGRRPGDRTGQDRTGGVLLFGGGRGRGAPLGIGRVYGAGLEELQLVPGVLLFSAQEDLRGSRCPLGRNAAPRGLPRKSCSNGLVLLRCGLFLFVLFLLLTTSSNNTRDLKAAEKPGKRGSECSAAWTDAGRWRQRALGPGATPAKLQPCCVVLLLTLGAAAAAAPDFGTIASSMTWASSWSSFTLLRTSSHVNHGRSRRNKRGGGGGIEARQSDDS